MVWTVDEFVDGFFKLIDHLEFDRVSIALLSFHVSKRYTNCVAGLVQVHIFGASLGAFLAQKLAERSYRSPRVHSLFLCNGFTDTTAFKQTKSARV